MHLRWSKCSSKFFCRPRYHQRTAAQTSQIDPKDIIHQALKWGRGIDETKGHYQELIVVWNILSDLMLPRLQAWRKWLPHN